eukprot:scpid52002/ scgid19763/ Crystal protein
MTMAIRRGFVLGLPVVATQTLLVAVISLVSLSTHVVSGDDTQVVAKTVYGEILGSNTGSCKVFRGVPYARSPDGERRFKPPGPPLPWGPTLILHTLKDGPGCPQANCSQHIPALGCPPETSENCLFLNIFVPVAKPRSSAGHPVMFWIHGGNFRRGFGGGPLYDGQHIANSSNVIVVSINYRLGALGFLTSSSGGLRGNFGLMDQRKAMEWVKENIAFFDGDPNSVTLFGQSAGAMSVATHLASARSAGLFHKAILESEPFGIYMRSKEDAERMAAIFFKTLGCAADDPQCWQYKPTRFIMEAQAEASKHLVDLINLLEIFIPWTPTIDGDEVVEEPLFSFQKGNIADIPIIIGTVSEECVMYIYGVSPVKKIPEAEYNLAMDVKFGRHASDVQKMYVYKDTGSGDTRDHIAVLGTDYVFRCPTRNTTRSVVSSPERSQPVYRYIFNHSMSFDGWGPVLSYCMHRVCHGSELVFIFQPNISSIGQHYTPEELVMSNKLIQLWTNFAHTGNPNSPHTVPDFIWQEYHSVSKDNGWMGTINITANAFTEFLDVDYESERCDFWDQYGYRD